MSYLMLPTEALTERSNGEAWNPQSGTDRRGQALIAWCALAVVAMAAGTAMLLV